MIAAKDRESTRKRIADCCRKLILSQTMVELCEQQGTPKQERFLADALEQEVKQREQSKRARQLNRALFPVLKSVEGYEFGAIHFPPMLEKDELLSCRFIEEKKNLILYGPVGVGKTHLAIALGAKACALGMNVRFHTVTELVLRLGEAHRAGTLEKLVRELKRLDLLILDEWGYVPVDKEGSQLLFRIVADSYESKSMILTTNLEFSKWGGIFTDEQMAAAMIDRLVHHGHLLLFEGQSYRMRHSLMRQTAKTGKTA